MQLFCSKCLLKTAPILCMYFYYFAIIWSCPYFTLNKTTISTSQTVFRKSKIIPCMQFISSFQRGFILKSFLVLVCFHCCWTPTISWNNIRSTTINQHSSDFEFKYLKQNLCDTSYRVKIHSQKTTKQTIVVNKC